MAYAQPCLGENRWGGTSITYTGITTARRWGQLETYGGKLVENIVQAIARDLLVTSMHAVAQARHKIVMHAHDEIVIDEPLDSGFTAPMLASSCPRSQHGPKVRRWMLTGMSATITARTREPRALVLASSRELQCERVEQWDCVDRC